MNGARIAVVGLGNLMRTDDAVGMLAIQQLRADPRLPDDVLFIEGGTLGLDLLHPLAGVTHLLALDAVDAGTAPGTVLRFAGPEVAALPVSKSVHLLGFADLTGAMQLLGDAPQEIVVLGVQPKTIGWGTKLTPEVEAAVPQLIEAALEQVSQWERWSCAVAETPEPERNQQECIPEPQVSTRLSAEESRAVPARTEHGIAGFALTSAEAG